MELTGNHESDAEDDNADQNSGDVDPKEKEYKLERTGTRSLNLQT